MNSEDLEIVRSVRRELAKHNVDITRLDIQVTMGRVTVGGIVTNLRDHPDVDLKDVFSMVDKRLSRDRLIKQYTNQARLIQASDKSKEEVTARGRIRNT